MLLHFCNLFNFWLNERQLDSPISAINLLQNVLFGLKHVKKIYLTQMCSWKWKGYFNGFFK